MADEIEKYLLVKLSEGLQASKLSHHSKFLKLQKQLKDKLTQSPSVEQSKLCREKLYQLNNLLAEYKTVSSTPLREVWFRQTLDSRLNKIKQELQGTEATPASSHGPVPPPIDVGELSSPKKVEVFRWSSRSVDVEKVHGFEDEVRSLTRSLLCPEKSGHFNVIGIVGMGGIGKTTLCQLVFNNPEVKKHFLPRIWVCMSKQPKEDSDNKKEIVKRMLRCLGVEEEIIKSADDNHKLRGLIFALHLQLRGKKYLIVLDDAWNGDGCFGKLDSELTRDEKYWGEKLAYGLPKGCGGTVIVTTRSEEVGKSMVGENLRRLQPISNKEICWQIFKDSVEKDGIECPEQEQLKNEILNKCEGLPLAAKMMGQIMHEKLLQNKLNSNQSPPDQNHPPESQQTNNVVV